MSGLLALDSSGNLAMVHDVPGFGVLWPVEADVHPYGDPTYPHVTQPFAVVSNPRTGFRHRGTDIGLNVGTPERAGAGGRIETVRTGSKNGDLEGGGYGNYVVINHGWHRDEGGWDREVRSLYAHLDSVAVVVGQVVEAGEEIGQSGNTGLSTGPHTHVEVRIGDWRVSYATMRRETGMNEAEVRAIAQEEAQRAVDGANAKHYVDDHQFLTRFKSWGQQPKLLDLWGNFLQRLARFAPGWPGAPVGRSEPVPDRVAAGLDAPSFEDGDEGVGS